MTAHHRHDPLAPALRGGESVRRAFGFLGAGIAAGLVVVFGRSQPLLATAAVGLLGAAAALWIFFQPRLGFLALVLFVPTQFWWIDELRVLPGPLRYLDDLLLVLLAARVVGDRLRSGTSLAATRWDLPILVFLSVGLLSALVNQTPAVHTLAGLRAPLLYALLLYLVANAPSLFDRAYLDWIWRVMLTLALLQPLTAFYQYPQRGFSADALTGTLGRGGANDLGIFLLPFLFYLVSLRFDAGRKPRWALPGVLLLSLTTILCGSRAAWFVAIGVVLLLWGRRLVRGRAWIATSVAVALLALALNQVLVFQGAHSIRHAIGWKPIYAALFLISSGGGNLAYFPLVWRLVQHHAVVPFLGLGPGMVSSTAAVHLDAPLYRNVLYDYFGQTMIGLDGNPESQVLATGGELGPVGLAAGFAMVAVWFVEAWRARRQPSSDHERALATGVLASALAALVLTPIRNVWEIPHLAFALWLPGCILYASRRSRAG